VGALAVAALAGLAVYGRFPEAGVALFSMIGGASLCVAGAAFVLAPAEPDGARGPRSEPAGLAPFEALCLAAGDLVMRHGDDGRVLYASGRTPSQFGLEPKDLLDDGFYGRIHVADRPEFLRAFNASLHGGELVRARLRLRSGVTRDHREGYQEPSFAWLDMCLVQIRAGASDRGDGVIISVTRDVSRETEAREGVEAARAEAAIAISMKDRLLANVSHELRTPLNAILGFSEILGNEELCPSETTKRMEYAHIIHSSAEHLLSVVNLVLDMSKIEAGKFEILPEPFAWEPLVKDCCDMLRLKAETGRVELTRSETDGAVEIVADKRACRQILLNLLSNAVKFTPPGGHVRVGARVAGAVIEIDVTDTGIGIAAEDLPRLGEPFFQARSSYNRRYEGAGLGLSLVRGLVALHGGATRLESAPGAGTRVLVTLPLDCRTAPASTERAPRLETVDSIGGRGERKLAAGERHLWSLAAEERKIA
jgi:cell cycle sensor histidine kinase DivJ